MKDAGTQAESGMEKGGPRDPDLPAFLRNGLRFACTRCGACCRGAPGVVRIRTDELQAAADYLGTPLETLIATATRPHGEGRALLEHPEGACIFLQDDRCLIHPVKPGQCRRYPFWLRTLRSEAAWAAEQQHCPGIGQGRRYSAAEILERLHEELQDYPDR